MRSSWEASATNCRSFTSDACRAASAPSTLSSMWLKASPTRPTSLTGSVSASGTRTMPSTSPLSSGRFDTVVAVAASRFSGARLLTTTPRATSTAAAMTTPVSSASNTISEVIALVSWLSGMPTITRSVASPRTVTR